MHTPFPAYTKAMLLAVALGLTGCASTITAVTGRPITSDHLDEFSRGQRIDLNKIKTLSGDRRLIRVQFTDERSSLNSIHPDRTYNSKWIMCAETQADAIAARGGQSALTVNAQGSGTDQYAETLMLTNARSQLSDVVRQLGWQVCNAFMNGALTRAEYKQGLQTLITESLLVLKPVEAQVAESALKAGGTVEIKFPEVPKALPEAPAKPCKPKKGKTCPEVAPTP